MADSLNIKVGGAWKTADPSIKVGGSWVTPDSVHIKVGGSWKEVWASGPSVTVSPIANGDTNSRGLGTCYVGIGFKSDGIEYECIAASPDPSISQGAWLDSGAASDVWIEVVNVIGSFTTGPVAVTRTQASSGGAVWYNSQSVVGSNSCTVYFKFWDAPIGGNLLATTSSATWTATRT